ncbi:MAG: hypothetical protein K2X87_18095 [Gemmataceae bacterium]|nr:hypothetical protein [Gemmataceae bacterium]
MRRVMTLAALLAAAPAAFGQQAGAVDGYNVGGRRPQLPWNDPPPAKSEPKPAEPARAGKKSPTRQDATPTDGGPAAAPARATTPPPVRTGKWAWMPPPARYEKGGSGWHVRHDTHLVTADPPPGDPGGRPPTAADAGAAIDALDAQVAAGMAELGKAVAELEKDSKGWDKVDRSVAAAKRVNAALLKRSEEMVKVYDDRVGPAVTNLKAGLETAPELYLKLAADRLSKAEAAAFPAEREAYATQAELARAAAELCRRRLKEVFTAPDPKKVSPADALAESMTRVRKMAAAHRGWTEVLDAWPSTLNDPKLAEMVEQLHRYSTDLIDQQKQMDRLTKALKAKAEEANR